MEHRIKTIDELTLMDDYMFAQVMRDTRHLKPLLQFILQVPIAKIERGEEAGVYDAGNARYGNKRRSP